MGRFLNLYRIWVFLGFNVNFCGFDSDLANRVRIIWYQSTNFKIKVISIFLFLLSPFVFRVFFVLLVFLKFFNFIESLIHRQVFQKKKFTVRVLFIQYSIEKKKLCEKKVGIKKVKKKKSEKRVKKICQKKCQTQVKISSAYRRK